MNHPFKISVLISGGGTTLKNLIEFSLRDKLDASIVAVVSNNQHAAGIQFAKDAGIATFILDHRKFDNIELFSDAVFGRCREAGSDLVVMGGFLRRLTIPADFQNRVVNIHPSLIPSFCGKGFYGSRVHKAVLDYGCKLTGCTVHFVDDQFDHGPIIAQSPVHVLPNDTAKSLAERVFEQECKLYPDTINAIANGKISLSDRTVTISNPKHPILDP